MRFTHQGYDLTLAVVARRHLQFSVATPEQRHRRVWQPTDRFLNQMSRARPRQVTCVASQPYHFPEDSPGTCVNVYAVNGKRQVAYLGTVFSQQAEADDRAAFVARLRDCDPDQAELFDRGKTTIIREACFCRIPSPAARLTTSALTKAVQWYFQTLAPRLADTNIRWLPKEVGAELDRWMAGQAERTARKSTVPWGF